MSERTETPQRQPNSESPSEFESARTVLTQRNADDGDFSAGSR